MTDAIETKPPIMNATTRLSVDRTRLSYERTMMSWIRTATSLITFGFSLYKFFQIEGAGVQQDRLVSATMFSALMIVIGLVSLTMATLQHRRELNALKAEYPAQVPRSLARVLAALISVLGILALVAVVLRR